MNPGTRSTRSLPTWAILTLVFALVVEAELALSAAFLRPPAALPSPVKATLIDRHRVAVRAPVSIRFDRPLDTSRLEVITDPPTPVLLRRSRERITLLPQGEWLPGQIYSVWLKLRPGFDQLLLPRPWGAIFETQPRLSVSGFKVGGSPVGQQAAVGVHDDVQVDFPAVMDRGSVGLLVNGAVLDSSALAWAPDSTQLAVELGALQPYQPVSLEVPRGASTAAGDLLTEGGSLQLLPVPSLPSNPSSGVVPGSPRQTPIEVVFDNAPPARPQSGLQQADIVYEYLSEYQVSRMTGIYFAALPGALGPVRSCRMVNPYLGFAFQGLTMCSGASVGTLHYMFGNPEGGVLVPGSINDFDRGDHFYRSGARPSPHNVYTTPDRANRLREEVPLPPGAFTVAPPHADVEIGQPAGVPDVPLHSVSYAYDADSALYARFDHGQPFIDAGTGGQIQVKNVVLLHVPFHDAGWIEDDNGGAHSVWYDVLGSGPAEIYSHGRVLDATWHMGSAPGQAYHENHTPVWFSDAAGRVVELNSGLTWVHVLGNGQTG